MSVLRMLSMIVRMLSMIVSMLSMGEYDDEYFRYLIFDTYFVFIITAGLTLSSPP